jgi:SnoaL-like domain
MTADEADRSAVADLICRFQRAFDTHDWGGLESCLQSRLQVDYSDLRGLPPQQESASSFCRQRKDALDHLDLQHNFTNLVVIDTMHPGQLQARCNFQIYRFERSGPRHFHTFGTYVFGLERDPKGDLRISSIQQSVTRSSGDHEIHFGVNPK